MDAGVIGRTKTVLVFGEDDTAAAVVSTITVRTKPVKRRTGPSFTGVGQWDPAICTHVREVLIPVVDAIADGLTVPKVQYDIGVANIGAASAMDVGVTISGFSADVPLVLAMLSARLGMVVPEDVVSTGHIASKDGDICFVRQIPAKLAAALSDPSIRVFVHPSTGNDVSLQKMTPRERDDAERAIRQASDRIRFLAVGSVEELVAGVFPERTVVLAGLRNGYLFRRAGARHPVGVIGRTADRLSADGDTRFLRVLERDLTERRRVDADESMTEWLNGLLANHVYPSGMGLQLYRLLLALPPHVWPALVPHRLLSISACIALSQFAGESDADDVAHLFRVADGARWLAPATGGVGASGSTRPTAERDMVSAVLDGISQEAVTREVAAPIDQARSSFMLGSVLVEDPKEFEATTSAFYVHLSRNTGRLRGSDETGELRKAAKDLVEQTFSREGGYAAARAEARTGSRGGMRFVLDAITDYFKREQRESYISFIVHQTVADLDWDERVKVTDELLRRLAPDLPPDISVTTPERYAKMLHVVLRAYATSMDPVKAVLKTM